MRKGKKTLSVSIRRRGPVRRVARAHMGDVTPGRVRHTRGNKLRSDRRSEIQGKKHPRPRSSAIGRASNPQFDGARRDSAHRHCTCTCMNRQVRKYTPALCPKNRGDRRSEIMIKQRPRTQPTTRSRASNPHLVTRARALVTRVHASDARSRASSRQSAGLFRPLPFAAATAT